MKHMNMLLCFNQMFFLFINIMTVAGCPNSWIPFEEHCYLIVRQQLSWWDAKKYCNDIGSYLTRIETSSENEWLKTQIRSSVRSHVWTGGTDDGHEGTWRWESNNKEIEFRDFNPDQPNNSGGAENCLDLRTDFNYRWNDYACQGKLYAVCEKAAQLCISN